MKFSGDSHCPPPPPFPASIVPRSRNSSPCSDLRPSPRTFRRPARRRPRTPATRVRRNGAPNDRRSRPETPLSKWKILEMNGAGDGDGGDPLEEYEKPGRDFGRKRAPAVAVPARKLAAWLWRLQLSEVGDNGRRINGDRLGLQHGVGHVDLQVFSRQHGMMHGDLKNLSQNPCSISRTKTGHLSELGHSVQFSSIAMEGRTKWDPVCLKISDEVQHNCNQMKLLDQKVSAVSALEAELDQARTRIQELETERHSSKKKVEHFLKKVSEEKASWRIREHEKIRAYIDDIKAELNRERKSRQRSEIFNSRLVNELADAKLLAKRYMQDYEKERKAKELIEEVCDELAKEIGEDKAEVEVLKRESMKFREEVEEERRMLQMAEVWREERVQMKLIDAKVAVDEKYSQMNELVSNLETFLRSVNVNPNAKEMREANLLKKAAATMNIQDIKGFSYEPPDPDDIFAIFEDVISGEPKKREIEPCVAYSPVSPEVNVISKDNFQRRFDASMDDNGDIEDDESGWETVSHVEDQGSSCSPEGSIPSVTKNHRESNFSGRSGLEWEENAGEETPITAISEVCSVTTKPSKKPSSIARFWRSGPNNADNYKIISVEGMNGRPSNGKLSNGSIMSPYWELGKDGLSPQDILCQLSSPESESLHNQGMKGCIPRGAQKNSLKARLLEARMDSQKVQLRHVLKQKV